MSVANHEAAAVIIPPILVPADELSDFRFDGRLKHLSRSFSDDLVQGTAGLELRPELDDFAVERIAAGGRFQACFWNPRG